MVYRMIFNQTAYFGRGAIKEIPGVAKSHGFFVFPYRYAA